MNLSHNSHDFSRIKGTGIDKNFNALLNIFDGKINRKCPDGFSCCIDFIVEATSQKQWNSKILLMPNWRNKKVQRDLINARISSDYQKSTLQTDALFQIPLYFSELRS